MAADTNFDFAGYALDLRRGMLSKAGQDLVLRPKSFALLRYMVENAGRLVPRDELFQALWPDVFVTDDSLTKCVIEVRRALGDEAQTILKTVPKRGYILAAPVSCGPPPGSAASEGDRPPLPLSARDDDEAGEWAQSRPDAAAERPNIAAAEEIRIVTLVSARLYDAPRLVAGLGPEAARATLAQPLKAMVCAIRQRGGIVLQSTGDGVLAAFGAPRAQEQHAILACHAALDIVAQVARLDDPALQVKIGVHTGHVVGGTAPADGPNGGDLAGAPILAIETVQSRAEPGGILACAQCRRLAEGAILFEAAPVKGDAAVAGPLWRVVGIGSASSWQVRAARSTTRFVGRNAETTLLKAAAATAAAGRGQAILIAGEPGIGKSRLVHEVILDLQKPGEKNPGWRLIELACDPFLQDVPYGAAKALLRLALAGRDEATETAAAAIDRGTQGLPPLWRAGLRVLLDLDPADAAWTALEPHQRGRAIADAACALLEAALRHHPTIVLVEDLHWLDPASAPILARIAGLGARHGALFLLTSRPGPDTDWCDRQGLPRLRLPPLDDGACGALLDALLGAAPRLNPAKQRILHHTGGVPLFVEEVCRDLLDQFGPAPGWDAETLARLRKDLGVPVTVQGVIAQRIDRLAEIDREILQLAAVIGGRCGVDLLRAVSGLAHDQLRDRLTALDQSGLLVERGLLPHHEHEFVHDLVRQVAYESILETTRQRRHGDILAALQRIAADGATGDEAGQWPLLCRHAVGAGRWTEARCYGRLVARTCLGRSAFADAARYFEIAIDAVDRLPADIERERDAIDLRIEARLAFSGSGRIDRRMDLSQEAGRRAAAIGDETRQIAALAVTASLTVFTGVPGEAIALCGDVLDRARQRRDEGWVTTAEYALGLAYLNAGRYRDAAALVGETYARLTGPDPAVPPGISVRMQTLLCCLLKTAAHAELDEFAAADFFRQQAQALGCRSDRTVERIAAGCCEGLYQLLCGDPAAAQHGIEATLALAEFADVSLYIPVLRLYLGMAALASGRGEHACEQLTEAKAAAAAIGYTAVALRAAIHLGRAQAQDGALDTAIAEIAAARSSARQQGFQAIEAEALFAEGEIRVGGNAADRRTAADWLERSVAAAAALGAERQIRQSRALLQRLSDADAQIRSRSGSRAELTGSSLR